MRSLVRKIVSFTIGCGIFLSSFWLFKINHIECQLDTQPCPEAVVTELQSLRGQSLFFSEVETQFTQQPTLTQYQLRKLKKQLPGTLFVSIVAYPTTYQLRFEENGETYLINAQRQLTAQSLPELKTITTSLSRTSLVQANQLDSHVHFFLTTLIQALAENQLETTELKLEEKSIVRIGLKGGINGIISNESIHQQVTQLAFIEKNFDLMSIDQGIKVVDVRYTLPVLRTTYTW